MNHLLTAYKQVLRAEILIAIGFFAGCFFTGLMVGMGHFK